MGGGGRSKLPSLETVAADSRRQLWVAAGWGGCCSSSWEPELTHGAGNLWEKCGPSGESAGRSTSIQGQERCRGRSLGTGPRRMDPLLQGLTTPRLPLGPLGHPLCNLWEGKGKERGVGSGPQLRIPAPSAGRRLQQQTPGPGRVSHRSERPLHPEL